MLVNLRIKDFLLIPDADIVFHPGLNVITGETGGGKSLVLKALDFLLGARGAPELIAPGEEATEVSGVFRVNAAAGEEVIRAVGIEPDEDGTLVLRRVYRADKTNLCYANSSPVRVADLRALGNVLVDYLAQNRQLRLQEEAEQLEVLDRSAGLARKRKRYRNAYTAFRKAEKEYGRAREEAEEHAEACRRLEEELRELDALAPSPGEDVRLKEKISLFEHLAAVLETFQRGVEVLYEKEGSAYEALHEIIDVLDRLPEKPAELRALAEDAAAAAETLQGLADRMRAFAEEVEPDGENMEETRRRYDALQKAMYKYDMDLDSLVAHWKELPARLERERERVSRTEVLEKEVERLWEEVRTLGAELDEARRVHAAAFEKKLRRELASLGLRRCRFAAACRTLPFEPEHAGPAGFTRVEFLFSANPGIEPRPLKDVASGGELSRIMLGVQSLAGGGPCNPLLVFDEIDADIGARLGGTVGKKMKRLGEKTQVICITHLPHIAVQADAHFKIEKVFSARETAVRVVPLVSEEERIEELAHMLGAEELVEARSVSHVRKMLERAGHG